VRLAVYLDENFRPRRPLAATLPGLEAWAGVDFAKYLAAVADFAAQSGFAAFQARHAAHRARVAGRFREALASRPPVIGFYDRLFGARPGTRYHLVPGLLLGKWDYSAIAEPVPGQPEVYAVMTAEDALDGAGLPRPGDRTLTFFVHEVGHAYVNPLVERYRGPLGAAAAPLFERVRPAMTRQAYGSWELMLKEAWVRALVVLFIRDWRGAAAASVQVREEQARGFFFIDGLARRLDGLHRRAATPDVMATDVGSFLGQLGSR
jgi:hypothetical protein